MTNDTEKLNESLYSNISLIKFLPYRIKGYDGNIIKAEFTELFKYEKYSQKNATYYTRLFKTKYGKIENINFLENVGEFKQHHTPCYKCRDGWLEDVLFAFTHMFFYT